MVDVLTEITINRSVEIVSVYAADPDHAPAWYDNISSARWISSKPLQVGSQIAFEAQFLGRRLSYTYEVVAYEPGNSMVMQTAEGPFPMRTAYNWEALDHDKTRMTLRNTGKPSGFSKLVAPLMAMMMKKANRKDLKKLKTILEGEN